MRYVGGVKQRQRENVARYVYDLSKIMFAAAVVQGIVDWEHGDLLKLIVGAVSAFGLAVCGYSLDAREGS